NRLENEGDEILRRALADLFRGASDPLLVLKWKEVYEALENATDRCEDVANVIDAVVVVTALLFDFVNGFHDAANSIATVVSTRVLSPRYAVLWAAFFNFIAFLLFSTHVANTIGTGVVDPHVIDSAV